MSIIVLKKADDISEFTENNTDDVFYQLASPLVSINSFDSNGNLKQTRNLKKLLNITFQIQVVFTITKYKETLYIENAIENNSMQYKLKLILKEFVFC